jgi:hypothetical protein
MLNIFSQVNKEMSDEEGKGANISQFEIAQKINKRKHQEPKGEVVQLRKSPYNASIPEGGVENEVDGGVDVVTNDEDDNNDNDEDEDEVKMEVRTKGIGNVAIARPAFAAVSSPLATISCNSLTIDLTHSEDEEDEAPAATVSDTIPSQPTNDQSSQIHDSFKCGICFGALALAHMMQSCQCSACYCCVCISVWLKKRKSCPSCRNKDDSLRHNTVLDELVAICVQNHLTEHQRSEWNRRVAEGNHLTRIISEVNNLQLFLLILASRKPSHNRIVTF